MIRVGVAFLLLVVLRTATQAQNIPQSLSLLPYSESHSLLLSQFEDIFAPLPELVVAEPSPAAETWQRWRTIENFSFGKDRGSMTMITDLEALHPYLRDKAKELIRICGEKGIELAIVETYRTVAKQNEYKSMGKKYTRSVGGLSKHQYGLAIDVVPVIDSAAAWNNIAVWRKIGAVGEKLGLRWGGRWRRPFDPGHFEWTGGLTGVQLASGAYPSIPQQNEVYPCLDDELTLLKTNWKAWEAEQSSTASKDITKFPK
jgi:hypothetical protein